MDLFNLWEGLVRWVDTLPILPQFFFWVAVILGVISLASGISAVIESRRKGLLDRPKARPIFPVYHSAWEEHDHQYCGKCGSCWATHNGDGSCVREN